jgi:hypothetical protein
MITYLDEIKEEVDRVLKEQFGDKLIKYSLMHISGQFYDLFVKVTEPNLDLPRETRNNLSSFCDERECILQILIGNTIEGRNL